MKLTWTVTEEDVARVQAFVAAHSGNPLVVVRKRNNLANAKPVVSRQEFWRQMIAARLRKV